ncbi:hypothetical protein P3T76_014949 [Phytophthora citrophthora]|uniref:BZIP domain-containing protein n=1 Tax=Phytophthora citrophthora TaxID=4793 RepID=A0AAD9G045_9STRA|nr:hypothetical protein P3T76_014949 [Phytophthora citrophthora]
MQDKHTDNAFPTTFIGDYDALLEQQDDKSVASYNSYSLLSNQQLLTETEVLLSSLDAPPFPNQLANVATRTGVKMMDKEQKRRHRNALATVRRNRYRHKLKVEKEALELQEIELSKLLEKLKAERVKEEINLGQQMMLSMWRAAAIREQEKRREAEAQNQQLKAAVISRSNMINSVQSLMLQRSGDTKMDASAWCGEEEDGAAVFRAFKAELDFMYAKTDEVVRGMEFNLAWPMTYTPNKRQQDGVELYDSADATVLPYSYEQVCRAVSWMMLSDLEGNEAYQELLGNTATIKYPMKCRLKGGESARMTLYNVTRRYVEESRTVFVWRALYEGHDNLSGFHADETGWFVVRPSLTVSSADSSDSDEASSTILESYTHFVPMGMKNESSSDVDVERFASILIKAGEEEVKEVVGMLEKVLLDEKPLFPPCTFVNE